MSILSRKATYVNTLTRVTWLKALVAFVNYAGAAQAPANLAVFAFAITYERRPDRC